MRLLLLLVCALCALFAQIRPQAQSGTADCGIGMRLLVVSADGKEVGLPALTQTLDYLGTPYTLHVATERPGGLTPELLTTGCRANFHGIILATADVGYFEGSTWKVALTAAEVQALETYQAVNRVRLATWYTFPTPDRGFQTGTGVSTVSTPIDMTLTAAGRKVFGYLNPAAVIPIQHAFTYLARPFDSSTTPLLVDAAGNALAAITTYPDGRETLALTFDGNPYLLHSVVVGYGVVNWVTRGLFLGERHVYASPQVDDLFLGNEEWLPSTPCGTPPNDFIDGPRISGADLQAAVDWQTRVNQKPTTAQFRLTFAYNGLGASAGVYEPDTLTPAARSLQRYFHWVNHTYEHPLLNTVDYAEAFSQITTNNDVARSLGLTSFSTANLVTPEISGLENPEAMQAAADAGVRYVVSDASIPAYANPFPNNGIVHPLQPSILMIPRRANNLYYNAATPAGWAAEYNCMYRGYWGRDLSYAEILELESDQLLMHLLRGENDPWMFHQINLLPYDGARSLLTDLLDRTFTQYDALYALPVLSPTMDALGERIRQRMAYLSAGVTGTIKPGVGISITAARAATVPVTGLDAAGVELYGGQPITWVPLEAGGSTAFAVPAVWPLADEEQDEGALPSPWLHQDIGAVGAEGAAVYSAAHGSFTVEGAGADVWGTADAFHFAYQPIAGDTRIIARVASIERIDPWTKAGVMIRQSLDRNAAHGFMLVSGGKGLAFQRRRTAGGSSYHTAGPARTAPYWVRLDRIGTTVSAYASENGTTWTLVARDSIAGGATVYVGLGISSHVAGTTAAAVFDNVTVSRIEPPPPPPAATLPSGWSQRDIGSVGVAGATTFDAASGTFTVRGAGADIWGTADAFHFAHSSLSGDGSIVARVASVQNVHASSKAGIMMREALTTGSRNGFVLVTPLNGVAFQRRASTGGSTVATSGVLATAPYWVRLDRTGNVLSAYRSANGSTWSLITTHTITMGATVQVGLAVTSRVAGTLASATFDNVTVTPGTPTPPPPPPPPPSTLPTGWATRDIGAVGTAGEATFAASTGTFTVTGAGADVWGTADAFRFAYRPMTGDATIVARVSTVEYTHAWAKAGVMVRETLDPGSAHAFMIVSAGKGTAFQRRPVAGGTSVHTAGPWAEAPYWVKLQRVGSLITASASADGVTWTVVGSHDIPMAPTVYVGLVMSAHVTSFTGTATFTDVDVR